MTLLIIGLIVFIGIHLVPCIPSLKSSLLDKLGEKPYKGLFALVSFAGLLLIIFGKAYAEFVPVYDPVSWGRGLAILVMPVVFMLLVAANRPTNIKRFIRHPMLLGVTLWAAVHLLANGDQASIILFASLGIYSLFDIWSANQRGATKSTQVVPIKNDIIIIVIGLVAYVIFLYLHPYLFKVPAVL